MAKSAVAVAQMTTMIVNLCVANMRCVLKFTCQAGSELLNCINHAADFRDAPF